MSFGVMEAGHSFAFGAKYGIRAPLFSLRGTCLISILEINATTVRFIGGRFTPPNELFPYIIMARLISVSAN